MPYKLVLHKNRLEAFCTEYNITVPQVDLCRNIPINEGQEPLGDYSSLYGGFEFSGRIRVRKTVDLEKLPKRLSPKKNLKLVARMNEVLYHELRHHIQATTMQAFYTEGRNGDYNKRPIERDARSFAKRQMRSRQAFKSPIIELVKTA